MGQFRTVYASIGNPDDRLPQDRWTVLHRKFTALIRRDAITVHGEWISPFGAPVQSACIGFDIGDHDVAELKHDLTSLAGEYQQNHIVWADAKSKLLVPATT